MAITWENIRTLGLFFGPILLPKAISTYRSLRASSASSNLPIVAPSPAIQRALILLSVLTVVYLAKTLPFFAPEHIFKLTQSRLQAPVDVLFNRLAASRTDNTLTIQDQILRARFVNLESRLLYLQFGPKVVGECPFCSADDPKSFLYYALPGVLWPHVLNLIVTSVVTSSAWTGRHGSQWRTMATLGAFVTCALDIYLLSTYRYQANARALRLADLDSFHWSLRAYRYIALAGLNAALAWALYVSSTNRLFVQPPSPAERVENANRGLRAANSKLRALGILRNTTLRDEELRERAKGYWSHEVMLMSQVMEDREVVEGVKDALGGRIDIAAITKDADMYAHDVVSPLRAAVAQEEPATLE